MKIICTLVHRHGSKAISAGYSVGGFFFFFFSPFVCFQTRLVRPGKILAIRIHAKTVGYAVRVPSDLFAIAQMDLQDSAATSIAPNLRVWKNGTVLQADMWGLEMTTMSCNVVRWIPWKAALLNWNAPPRVEAVCLNHMVVTEDSLWNFSLADFF